MENLLVISDTNTIENRMILKMQDPPISQGKITDIARKHTKISSIKNVEKEKSFKKILGLAAYQLYPDPK